ncbi:hypothetical protein RAH32_03025 [Paracoccus sp. WLY502]|uniref:hypothetical protein n=1 Tax=Paracoccus yibinensis TaxID=3068891 RepID=UPI0027969A0C|nr:hypothetical protein [Paracoccus sp. WLY502]MDQ1899418.1 hypothetical protein [Paracoccus sp. WLY502]
MVPCAVFSIATGAILWTSICELGLLAEQAGAGQIAVLLPEDVADDTHYWDGTGFVPYPPCPGDWAVWNGAFWTDPRPPRDPAADLAARRAGASMTRANLVMAAVQAGIIPIADAAAAARGEITPSIQALIDQLPAEDQLEAIVRWAASTVIDRTNQILTALGASMGLTDEDLDQLFGFTAPTEE